MVLEGKSLNFNISGVKLKIWNKKKESNFLKKSSPHFFSVIQDKWEGMKEEERPAILTL